MSMTPKQETFCTYFVETGNQSEAYRRAYPASLKWKEDVVHRRASDLMRNGEVLGRVKQLQTETAKRNEITIDTLIQELRDVMLLNPKELIEESGQVKNIHTLPDAVAKSISEIKVTELQTQSGNKVITTVKVYNKLDAIEKLAKHLGFYEKDNKQKEQQQTVIVLPNNGR